MLLKYDIGVVGVRDVDRALSGIERRMAQHNARVSRLFGQSVRSASGRRPGSAGASATSDVKKIAAAQSALDRQRATALYRQHREKERLEKQSERNRSRQLEREKRDAIRASKDVTRARASMAREFQSRTGRVVSGVAGTVGSVGKAGLAAAGIGGAALIASQLSTAAGLEKRQRQVIVNARGPGQANALSYEDLRGKVNETSIATGASREDLTGGIERFVQKTGDIKTAVANMRTFATTAMATGASVEDVASSAADLQEQFKITDPKEMADALAVLAFQGKKGAFELRDMAEQFPEMSAAAARAGLTGGEGVKTLGGLAQIARKSTGSGAEASTAVQMMLTKLVAESSKLKSGEALGGRKVNIFSGEDATSPLRDTREVIADIISKSHGNLQQLQDVFDVRGIRAVSPMIGEYRRASAAAGGGKAGEEAGRQAILDMIANASDAGGTFADVQRDAADALQSTSVQLEILNTKLGKAIESDLLPALTRLIPHVTAMVPYFARLVEGLAGLVDFLMESPWLGLGAVIAGVITKELVSAGLGSVARGALQTAFGVGGTGGVGATPGAGSPKLAAAGMGAAIGITIAAAIFTIGVGNFEVGEVNMRESGKALNNVRAMTSPEQAAAARATLQQEEQKLGKQKSHYGWFDEFTDFIGYSNTGTEIKTQESNVDEIREIVSKLEALKAAADTMASAGVSQEEAAKKLTEAAGKLGLGPNRGNAPSPIKG